MKTHIAALALAALAALAACSPAQRQAAVTRMIGLEPVADPELQSLLGQAPRTLAEIPKHKLAAVLLLAETRDGVARWRTSDRVEVYTRAGMVIGTRGIGDDLMDLDDGGATAVILRRQSGQITRFYRVLDGESRIEIRSYICDITPRGDVTLAKDGQTVSAFHVVETCHGPRDTFVNQYWLEGGAFLQSEQNLTTSAGSLRLSILP